MLWNFLAKKESSNQVSQQSTHFSKVYFFEEHLELVEYQVGIPPAENFGDEGATWSHHKCRDVEGGEEELRLNVFIQVVKTSYIGRSVTNN